MLARDVLAQLVIEDGRRWVDAAWPWQLADAFAVLEGEQPYQFLTRSRGSSKTTDLAAVALALMLSAAPGSRWYWLAADADQGALAVDSIAGFAARTPWLAERLTIQSRRVVAHATGAQLDVLPADAPGAWGLRPDGVFVDELAQWSDTPAPRRLWEAVSTAVAKLPTARLVVLTTAGDPAHFAAKVLEHARVSPLWRVSERPGPAPWMAEDRLAEQRARVTPSLYARLFENVWTTAEDRLTSADALAACVTLDGPLAYDPAHSYVVALDLGLKRDATAATVCHREGERVVLDRIATWQGSRLKPVRLAEVEEWVEQAARSFGGAQIVLDPWQTVGLAQRLRERGVGVEEFAFTAQSVGRLAATLFNLLRDQALALPNDVELLDELANVRIRETSPGVFRLDHDPGRHDDRAIALALAATHLLRETQHGPIVTAPNPWDGNWAAWAPGHVDEFDARRADHERTMRHLRKPCDECVAEAAARRAAAAAPPPPPERRGQFLIDRHNHNRR